ncbi:MAG: rhomboid family intramembrane serine protease [Gaiellaceae bacterium]
MSTAQTRLPTCYRHPDRETGLSCSECGRPICTECMTVAPVGLRCPEHAGGRRAAGRPIGNRGRIVARAPHMPLGRTEALVTKALITVNVAIYLIGAVQGGGINNPMPPSILANTHALYPKLWLDGPQLAQGDWWRLLTTMFLHANLLHIGFNMLALWWFGAPVEQYLGRARFLGLYFVAGLAGSAGALVQTPGITVGASGAIFGVLGAMMILEWQATGRLGGNAMTLIVINLALSFAIANISIGGHIGGLIGGILATLAFARWGRGHAAYGRIGLGGALGLVLIAVASVAIAYWQVRGYA